ncbi:Glutamate N-acetyltransferase / Amino-acid acetyltransferase [Gammaproteobacteria bacterium]
MPDLAIGIGKSPRSGSSVTDEDGSPLPHGLRGHSTFLSSSNVSQISGIRLGTAEAAIKRPGRRDLLVIELAHGSTTAAVFTKNAFCAAPVQVSKKHMILASPRFWLVNSGNANAGTGAAGLEDAQKTCLSLATLGVCKPEEVLPFSTGVIGVRLPLSRLIGALPEAISNLSEDGWQDAACAIMTTDTVPKLASRRVAVGNDGFTIIGIAKGSGMIRPDMATMLAFLATDASVPQPMLQQCLAESVENSFNRITVDGDTSTNDSCVLAATGRGNTRIDSIADPAWATLKRAVNEVCLDLAKAIVKDGEGATRLVTVTVEEGASETECLAVAYAVAHSPLVKTALFAGDPNWGRILAAVGRSGLPGLSIQGVDLFLDEVRIVHSGEPDPEYKEEAGALVLAKPEYTVRVKLGRGKTKSTVWTCDLSYDYVRINAEYRS